jgi:Flp pilus assembly protein TadD
VSWQTVVVGDPLCAPFRTAVVPAAELDPPIDPETELPELFSARRLAAMGERRAPAVLKLLLRAETRLARSDSAGVVEALTKAVSLDETFSGAWQFLAAEYERRERYAEAEAIYRRLLTINGNDFIALNNLAYNLAVRGGRPKEGLPFATRAAALAPRNPTVGDTLGWIHHLLGNDQEALRLLEPASRVLTENAEVHFHVAATYASLGRLDDAEKALETASRLDPSLKARADFRDVQQKIKREEPGPS